MSTNESDPGEAFGASEISLPRPARFRFFILTDTPSVICSIILLFHLFGNRKARNALNNHVIALLIIFGLGTQIIDVSFYLSFIIHLGVVTPSQPAVCLIWWFIAYCLYNGEQLLMAWAAIERHILVFNDRWVSTRRGKILGHYTPLILLLIYIFTFYTYALFIFPCENDYAYDLPVCNANPCYQNDPILGVYDFVANNIVPAFVVALASIALLVRVIRQRQRLNQQLQWRRYRRMTIQLVSISALNIVFIMSLNLLAVAHLCGLPDSYGAQVELYLYFAGYLFIFLIPFVSLTSLPDLCNKIKGCLFRPNRQQKQTTVSAISVSRVRLNISK